MDRNPKDYEPLPERLLSATPFERFAYRLGFSRCPDFRLHADWHRFRGDLQQADKREGER